jgi:hypothetical protein
MVTGAPPPCGTSAMLSTLTPITAQSSVDASLINTDMVAFCGVVVEEVPDVDPEPPPHAARVSAARPHALQASNFNRMTNTSGERDR